MEAAVQNPWMCIYFISLFNDIWLAVHPGVQFEAFLNDVMELRSMLSDHYEIFIFSPSNKTWSTANEQNEQCSHLKYIHMKSVRGYI